MFETEDRTIYKVIINQEEQYAIFKAERENPLGWSDVGKTGTKGECQAYIDEVWIDKRPLSLRKKMAEMEREREKAREWLPPREDVPRETAQEALKRVELERAEEQNYNWRQKFKKS